MILINGFNDPRQKNGNNLESGLVHPATLFLVALTKSRVPKRKKDP